MVDPYSAAFSAIGGAVAGGPSSASTGALDQRQYQDGSGWTVATGSARADGAQIIRSGDPNGSPLGGALAGAIGGFDYTTLAIVALVAVVLIRVLRK